MADIDRTATIKCRLFRWHCYVVSAMMQQHWKNNTTKGFSELLLWHFNGTVMDMKHIKFHHIRIPPQYRIADIQNSGYIFENGEMYNNFVQYSSIVFKATARTTKTKNSLGEFIINDRHTYLVIPLLVLHFANGQLQTKGAYPLSAKCVRC